MCCCMSRPLHYKYRYEVGGLPTLKLFSKGNKAGQDYNGDRDLDDLVTFTNENCGTNRDAKGQLNSKVRPHSLHWHSMVVTTNTSL